MQEVQIKGVIENKLYIALNGDIDLGNAEAFYQETMTAYTANATDIVFECDGLNFIDSTTLGTFVKILKALKANGHTMRLTGLQQKIKKLFVICALDSVIQID